jgi:hypothetical protein
MFESSRVLSEGTHIDLAYEDLRLIGIWRALQHFELIPPQRYRELLESILAIDAKDETRSVAFAARTAIDASLTQAFAAHFGEAGSEAYDQVWQARATE